jgi:hypothetical protein
MLHLIAEGLGILAKYDYNKDAHLNAEHDEIYIGGPKPTMMKLEDAARLAELNFSFDEAYDCWHRFT